jgi:hypothetical protein
VKNQNDLIIAIVTVVGALIVVGIVYGMKPQPKPPGAVPAVALSDAPVDGATVQYSNGLQNAGRAGGAGAFAGRPPGGFGGRGGVGAPPGPMGVSGISGGSTAPPRPMGTSGIGK